MFIIEYVNVFSVEYLMSKNNLFTVNSCLFNIHFNPLQILINVNCC